ncbi:MAG: anti-sigma factor family protein [Candidatus Binataceae bacterium]
MAECSQISLLLGAFEDGELEPHEMQEVARHLAECGACEDILAGYAVVGRELRALQLEPNLSGFSTAVLSRIGEVDSPLRARIERAFGRIREEFSSVVPTAALTAAVAILTAVVLTPYAGRMADWALPGSQLAQIEESADLAAEKLAAEGSKLASDTHDSRTVISRLETRSPSVAVWSEPRSDTTVIWFPDQP